MFVTRKDVDAKVLVCPWLPGRSLSILWSPCLHRETNGAYLRTRRGVSMIEYGLER